MEFSLQYFLLDIFVNIKELDLSLNLFLRLKIAYAKFCDFKVPMILK